MKTLNTVIHFSSKHIYRETELYYISILNPAHAREVPLFPVFLGLIWKFSIHCLRLEAQTEPDTQNKPVVIFFSVEL